MDFRRKSMINQTNVSLTIAKHLFSKQSNNNIVFSPLSIQVILSIIAAGSEGTTKQQLLDFLRFKSIDQLNSVASRLVSVILKDSAPFGGPRLSVANGVWVEQTLSLQSSFEKILSSDFQAKLASVDFQNKAIEVTNEVNSWVEKETNGLIKGVIQPGLVNNLTRLIFANALYFKGLWYDKFDASKTKDYDFHLLNRSSLKVPFMSSKEDQYIGAFDGFKVLCLPYKQGQDDRRFSMYFILPDAKHGLSALVEKVASESELLHHKFNLSQVKVGDFRIPRFNVSFGFETSDMLKDLGVVLPFSPGGLTNMVDSLEGKDLYVSKIFQKSFIQVNEEGTEAAAATYAIVRGKGISPPRPRLDFVADHPFLFLIREDFTGTILFVGQVLNPLAG